MNPHDALTFAVEKKLLTAGFCPLQNGPRNQFCTLAKPALRRGSHHAVPDENLAKESRNPMNSVTLRHSVL
jgi:hypothetical protein